MAVYSGDKFVGLRQDADDRDSVRSNLTQMGPFGAMVWAGKRLQSERDSLRPELRRMLILTVQAGAREAERECRAARRLARYHAQLLRPCRPAR